MERRHQRRGPGWRIALGAVALLGVAVAQGQERPEAAMAQSPGAGVFELDAAEYFVQEGAAVPVTVTRTGGTTLTEDVTVTLELEGGTVNEDYPASTITQLATFEEGTNVTEMVVHFQTLNQARISHNEGQIQIFIRSVSSGSIGTIDSAPLTIFGNGAPRVFSVTPRSGEEGTTVTVDGINFTTSGTTTSMAERVDFIPVLGGPAALSISDPAVLSANRIRFSVPDDPNGLNSGVEYHVQVITIVPGVGTGNCVADPENTGCSLLIEDDTFVYVEPDNPTVTGLSRDGGPTNGGTTVRVFGTKFLAGQCDVEFGGVPVPAGDCTRLSGTTLEVVSPPGTVGTVNVTVTTTEGTSPETPENEFTYSGAPIITSVSPSVGPDTGGTTVTITGSGFSTIGGTVTSVAFGGDAASFNQIDSTTITAVSPPNLNGGTVQITVTHSLTGQSGFTTAANFTYVSGPVVQSLSPSIGSPSGGTTVTIEGVGFAPGATVTFGGVQAPFVSVQSATRISVTSPPGTGTVQVVVTVNGKSSPTGPESQFQYSGPRVDKITPNAGPTAGGTEVLIEGNNFTQAATVKFGDLEAAEMEFISPAMVMATSPEVNGFAEVHVTITTPSGISATGAQSLFTYTDGPIIDEVNPGQGPTTGGTIVVITGSNFEEGATVMFGGTEALAFNFNSQTQVTALSPPTGEGGPVSVRVITAAGTSPVSEPARFVYQEGAPQITAITPNEGNSFGGDTVTISGTGFLGAACPGAVTFGTAEAPDCTVINDTTIQAVTPANPSGPTVVLVNTPSGSSTIEENFTYVKADGSGSAGGSGNGGSGGDVGIPVPSSGETVSYTLMPTWNLVVWRGEDELPVSDALVGADGADLRMVVAAIYTYDPDDAVWLAYFTGAIDIPGANEFVVLQKDQVYWVSVVGAQNVQWQVLDH